MDNKPLRKRLWDKWIKIATVLGNVQMVFILTVIYWVLLPLTAIPFKFLSDPLNFKSSNSVKWEKREPDKDIKSTLRKQGYERKL